MLPFCSYVPVTTPTCNGWFGPVPWLTVLRCRERPGHVPLGGGFKILPCRDPGPEGRDVNVATNTARTGASRSRQAEEKREVAAVWSERAESRLPSAGEVSPFAELRGMVAPTDLRCYCSQVPALHSLPLCPWQFPPPLRASASCSRTVGGNSN